MDQAGRIARARQAQHARRILVGDAVERRFLAVQTNGVLRLIVFHIPVHIDHAGGLLEDVANLPRDLDLAVLRGAVNFGNHSFEHRRAGRHFGDLDAGAEMPGHGNQLLAHALGDVVALELALRLSNKVHLDIGDIGPAPQEVMAHQAIEVVRRGDARVGLEIDDLGLLLDDRGKLAGDACRLFERSPLGHVDDDLELALVVERQDLHLDEAGADEGHRTEQQHGDQRQKSVARRGMVEQRVHDATVEAGEAVLAFPVGVAGRRCRESGRRPTASPPGRRTARTPWRQRPRWVLAACRDRASPLTNAIGKIAAITVKVARIVGLPTSSTASMATCAMFRPWFCGRRAWRTMFSVDHNRVVHQDADGKDQRK